MTNDFENIDEINWIELMITSSNTLTAILNKSLKKAAHMGRSL